MTGSPYLTRCELQLWSGRKNRAGVTAWLRERRIAFVPDADDWPKVARALHDQLLGLAEPAGHVQLTGVDFSTLEPPKRRPRASR
jgi:hypothetical protein